jgi:hypothetical protein
MINLIRLAVETCHSGQVGQNLFSKQNKKYVLPVLHAILALICVTIQLANNVKIITIIWSLS